MFEPGTSADDAHETLPMPDAEAPVALAPQYPFRLIDGERVIASYPVASVTRPLGKLVSFLFVTDSRVVYAAESKTAFSSSTVSSEYRLDKVDGIQAGRHRGLDALGAGIAVAIVLNAALIGVFGASLAALLAGGSSGLGMYTTSPGAQAAGIVTVASTVVLVASLALGAVVVLALARPRGFLGVLAPNGFVSLAQDRDWLTIGVVVLLFLLFGPLIGVALLCWAGVRALGVFRASDAFLYAGSANLDAIAFDAGAVILDAQARGTLATS